MRRGVFVTGTDTGVGKTVAACAIVHAVMARGVRVMPMKPIAAGGVDQGGRWVNEDTLRLLEAAGRDAADTERVTPVLLREPMAPHIAAAREGHPIDLQAVVAAYERLADSGDFVVCEGVGGFRVPLDDRTDTVHLAQRIALPVVMVVGLRLGCLNHALLTAQAVEAAGLRLAGWIANAIDPAMLAPEENVAALRARLQAPLLGRLPFASPPDPRALAASLDVAPLLKAR